MACKFWKGRFIFQHPLASITLVPAVEPSSLSSITRSCDEQSNSIRCDLLVPGVDPYLPSFILASLHSYEHKVEAEINNLCHLLEGEANKGGGEGFCQNNLVWGWQIFFLPSNKHSFQRFLTPTQICHTLASLAWCWASWRWWCCWPWWRILVPGRTEPTFQIWLHWGKQLGHPFASPTQGCSAGKTMQGWVIYVVLKKVSTSAKYLFWNISSTSLILPF